MGTTPKYVGTRTREQLYVWTSVVEESPTKVPDDEDGLPWSRQRSHNMGATEGGSSVRHLRPTYAVTTVTIFLRFLLLLNPYVYFLSVNRKQPVDKHECRNRKGSA